MLMLFSEQGHAKQVVVDVRKLTWSPWRENQDS